MIATSPQVEIRANRIGVDTGAYRTGELSALYLEGDRQEVVSARLPLSGSLEGVSRGEELRGNRTV